MMSPISIGSPTVAKLKPICNEQTDVESLQKNRAVVAAQIQEILGDHHHHHGSFSSPKINKNLLQDVNQEYSNIARSSSGSKSVLEKKRHNSDPNIKLQNSAINKAGYKDNSELQQVTINSQNINETMSQSQGPPVASSGINSTTVTNQLQQTQTGRDHSSTFKYRKYLSKYPKFEDLDDPDFSSVSEVVTNLERIEFTHDQALRNLFQKITRLWRGHDDFMIDRDKIGRFLLEKDLNMRQSVEEVAQSSVDSWAGFEGFSRMGVSTVI